MFLYTQKTECRDQTYLRLSLASHHFTVPTPLALETTPFRSAVTARSQHKIFQGRSLVLEEGMLQKESGEKRRTQHRTNAFSKKQKFPGNFLEIGRCRKKPGEEAQRPPFPRSFLPSPPQIVRKLQNIFESTLASVCSFTATTPAKRGAYFKYSASSSLSREIQATWPTNRTHCGAFIP